MMDEYIGRILKTLDDLGLTERTLIVFTSDHGNMLGEHGLMEKSVGAFYDDLMRVPLIMRLPGQIPAGAVCEAAASSVDIAPTILDLVGAEPLSAAHGHSLTPIAGGAVEEDRPVFGERGELEKPNTAARMVRTRAWKLSWEERNNRKELFDLAKDPNESHDLSRDPAFAPVVERLSTQLLEHMREVKDVALPRFAK
jgi:arylsulfatase A-like enzyme